MATESALICNSRNLWPQNKTSWILFLAMASSKELQDPVAFTLNQQHERFLLAKALVSGDNVNRRTNTNRCFLDNQDAIRLLVAAAAAAAAVVVTRQPGSAQTIAV